MYSRGPECQVMSEYSPTDLRFGAGIWMFGQFLDRYATDGYGPPVAVCDAIRLAGSVGSLEAVDLNYPFWDAEGDVARIQDALLQAGLRASAVTPSIYTREFRGGAFTNPDPKTRQRAVELVARATEAAYALGADYVKLWPGQDGHDYPFQVDHGRVWELALDGLRQVAEPYPGMRFAIEYKPREPRIQIVFSTAAKTLLGIEQVGLPNLGILLDLGHSLNAGETPAEAAQLILTRSRLLGVDFNDNFRRWDDDLAVASVHLMETVEFLLVLRQHGWKGLWQLDQFPFREDPVAAARASIRTLTALHRVIDRLDLAALAAAQERHDALEAQRLVQDALFGNFIDDHPVR